MSTAQYHPVSDDLDDSSQGSLEQTRPFIPSSEKDGLEPPRRGSAQRYRQWALGGILFTLCMALGAIIGYSFFRPRWTHCGSTVEEAHARHCQYDVMIGSWLLPECSDIELMEKFLAERDWEFYHDQNLTHVIPMDELRRGEHTYPVWASVHQHQHHCSYVWMKQFRSVVAGKKLDDLSASVHHSSHCANGLYTGMPWAKENLALAVKYFSCVKAGDGNPRRSNNPNNSLIMSS